MPMDLFGDVPTLTRADARKQAIAAARKRAELAMVRAAGSLERYHAEWCTKALGKVREFARGQAGVFTIEQMRLVLEPALPEVLDRRVWGKVTVDAVKAGYLQHVPRVSMPVASSNGAHKGAYRRGKNA